MLSHGNKSVFAGQKIAKGKRKKEQRFCHKFAFLN
jgi:hypothetical protein